MLNDYINRAYLETLPFSGLLEIADSHSIDVSENINRGFLIGEILEAVSEAETSFDDSELKVSEEEIEIQENELLPKSYNSTEVKIMLRNPAWAYIYWNISEADQASLQGAFVSEIKLRVNSYSEKNQIKPDEYFDFQISGDDNGQYVFLPSGKKFFRVDLLFNIDGIIDILASSNVLEMPKSSRLLSNIKPGKSENLSPIMKISGTEELILKHYQNHRESFS